MARLPAWVNPLDEPLAVATAGLLLVAVVRLGLLALVPGLLLGLGAALLLAALGRSLRRRPSQDQRLHDRRVEAGIDAALLRASELAAQAETLRLQAIERFTATVQLEGLGRVQLCCERLAALPQRLESRRPLLQSGGGVLLSTVDLSVRLRSEQQALTRDADGPLRQERRRLVDQLSRNLSAAHQGMDEREARLLALATRLEAIDGGLQLLRRQIEREWNSEEASDAALTAAIDPLDGALDQIERLLDAGRA
ncbi:hypothetical protein [Cyanobium sp. Morenito 9A2]|uniref:hypothetical protein n=1 Tax=Cyanobium sp. Morenito 9A2 TaxID=2823718 RepID=UPI0020CD8A9D|nr:hypothetical protein [Cyanobium sp. Morenito 9A2]MCP9848630.1 hypothetical protein [Cyanobium sp. Morenito 9A2]